MCKQKIIFVYLSVGMLFLSMPVSVDAVVVGIQESPKDGVVTAFDVFRSLGSGGWVEDDTRVAADGNEVLTVSLNPANDGYNAGNNGAGYVWYLPVSDYTDALGEATAELQNGWVIRHSAWIAEDANDPLLNEGDWTDSFKLEFGKAVAGGFTVLSTGAADISPNNFMYSNCDLGAGTCSTEPQAPLPYPSGSTGHINSSGWTQLVHQYEIDDFDFSGDNTVADIAVVRPVLFLGDFTSSEDQQGTLYMDRIMVEIFPDLATANATPLDSINPGGIPDAASVVSADFDEDGDVDGADFLTWQRDLGDATNLGLWQNEYGTPVASSVASVIPEPSSVLLAFFALSATGLARKNRRRECLLVQ